MQSGDGRSRGSNLGAFLRSRRERLTPEAAGIQMTGRRRTPGLRREEIAVLAGISTTWYTYLEQGREVRPSVQVVEALARALNLDRAERLHLHYLAGTGLAPASDDTETLSVSTARVVGLLDPAPAYITGLSYDVLAYNAAASELFPSLVADPGPNLARWVLLDPAAREVLVDWSEVARDIVARLRGTLGRRPNDGRLACLVEELRSISSEAETWWSSQDVRAQRPGIKRVRHPLRGVIILEHSSFQVTDRPEQTLVIYWNT
ncbi:helix-turn-helix transcriptional regulator [Jatrophihabitans lederbergiae]|jgi:transcriptional regulator with XRE-family HTH domain|uniref:Helix-turn-helix transcriptional regulator n=1 Tax=Jatrophihabitans lederbergiae TaxID=3075547 RepID=A0ABU2JH94_9ACTN|nr:helix-turn-helix transcriptional regulator [Jatrophihabitans sp. DSM 44399]MDT0264088.1 helix-turn-helix transcriptional regulator [Jatrophihabitans sp. DSM 44399]